MTELQAFLRMLERAGIGHGVREDRNPPGTGVQVEHDDEEARGSTDWLFGPDGMLVSVTLYAD